MSDNRIKIMTSLSAKELTEASERLSKAIDRMTKYFAEFASSKGWSEINKAGKQFEKITKNMH